ncbi:MAG: excinuclease ABC subunit UvrC [Ignavibacteriales bacterium]
MSVMADPGAVEPGVGERPDAVSAAERLHDKIKNLPESPGVYLFKDSRGRVIYVGKAISLRNRVRSYFQSSELYTRRLTGLLDNIADMEFITTSSEVEALILESNLIKKYKPRYNIKLRDDKHYPYIRVTLEEEWPRALIARSMKKDGSRYFGPYTRTGAVRETLRALHRVLGYRTCTNDVFKNARRPCLNYHIGRCMGPCRGLVDRETYAAAVRDMCSLLEGRGGDVIKRLKTRMERAAEALDFETAARLRDQLRAIQEIGEKQSIIIHDMKDRDVVGLASEGNDACVQVFQVREGKMLGRETFALSDVAGADQSEILGSFMKLYYSAATSIPVEVVLPALPGEPAEWESIEAWLTSLKGSRVRLRVPARGRLRDLVDMAAKNARLALDEMKPREEREYERLESSLDKLASAVGLPSRPRRIEGYDISNIQGKQPVGSMVVFTGGRPDKDQYRRFHIRSKQTPDDFAMMQEMLLRRFRRGLAEREAVDHDAGDSDDAGAGHGVGAGDGARGFVDFPDLVMVDGGKGQLSAAVEVVEHLGLRDIPIIGLAKQEEEIFLPGRSDPVILPRDSDALFLIQRLRDEAHRFAIGYHRKLRGKEGLKSLLDEVPGIGPKRRSALLKRFGSVRSIAAAEVEEIARVEGIGPELARKVKDALAGV